MRETGSNPVIVRTYAPLRRVLALIATLLLFMFALYVIYEFGRYNAGYDRLAVAQQRAELEVAIDRLKDEKHELNLRLAQIDTQRIGWAREQAEVSHTIGDLQAKVARQAQDLAFYRGAGSQSAPTAALGVTIQQLRIGATAQPAKFVARTDQAVPLEIRAAAFEEPKPAGKPIYTRVALASGDAAVLALSAVREDPSGDPQLKDAQLRRELARSAAAAEAQSYGAAARADAKVLLNPQAID